ncbi:flavin-containing monooxygenase [Phyllobacterium myrsinacearum]|uniref:Putative flavoprotein involved in K+ transport n=1 Tax=Phyllobacterium myrsinacearum TaxID=28101 RepID=A0A839ENZ2_9HYPH|nr:putative flavoprotein involved in K+ transport [Phyllobacterium myrsinacearum]
MAEKDRELGDLDVLVIGGGQAGLAAGYHLKKTGVDFLIVEGGMQLGDSWRNRYDALTLFTPRAFSQLPGLELKGDPDGYAHRDEFADYLQNYARKLELPIRLGTPIVRLAKLDRSAFVARLANGSAITARRVIIAVGAFQRPKLPTEAYGFSSRVTQLTTSSYRNPMQVTDGPVLIIGDGASGRDIAADLATTHEVLLATGRQRRLLPETILGRNIWWWLEKFRFLQARPHSVIGRFMRKADPFPDRERSLGNLTRLGITIKPRLFSAAGQTAIFADETSTEISSVIWTTGYVDENSWIDIAGTKSDDGAVLQYEGVSPLKGLFYVGRPWQRNRASALIMGAGPDAEFVVARALVRD